MKSIPFTLTQVRHFLAVADTGRISLAAEQCRIAQPSLSTSIRMLEENIGVTLFRRAASGLALTPAGERFLRHATHLAASALDAAEDTRRPPQELAGTVTLGVTDTISGYLIPGLLQHAQQRMPLLSVEVLELARAEAEDRLLAGELDLALLLVSNLSGRRGLAHETLLRSPRRLWTCVDHPLLQRRRIGLSDVADENYILLDMDEHVTTFEKYWAKAARRPRIVLTSKSLEGIRSLVAQGFGVSILSDLIYRPWSHDGGRIRRIILSDDVPSMDVGLVYRKGGPLPPIAGVLAGLVREFAVRQHA
ncbi:LysR family transcriptional regulator [Plastoroseomonas hellenica]|uniref:LysR family transcriptional regulator n=1 Tax=Plastoroseomonas hellenica TaxID=2687306 RepID=UPI001BA5F0B4|nr:LysR family transcriptional regulator [Plastoroseomonas hellenica]MBR0647014.1 LysR family transcriptional regulator [Plastoroseomonas hellenica]